MGFGIRTSELKTEGTSQAMVFIWEYCWMVVFTQATSPDDIQLKYTCIVFFLLAFQKQHLWTLLRWIFLYRSLYFVRFVWAMNDLKVAIICVEHNSAQK